MEVSGRIQQNNVRILGWDCDIAVRLIPQDGNGLVMTMLGSHRKRSGRPPAIPHVTSDIGSMGIEYGSANNLFVEYFRRQTARVTRCVNMEEVARRVAAKTVSKVCRQEMSREDRLVRE